MAYFRWKHHDVISTLGGWPQNLSPTSLVSHPEQDPGSFQKGTKNLWFLNNNCKKTVIFCSLAEINNKSVDYSSVVYGADKTFRFFQKQ